MELVAELSGKERANVRALYKGVARIIAALLERWDRKKHAALRKDEHKAISFEPQLIVYPLRSGLPRHNPVCQGTYSLAYPRNTLPVTISSR